MRFYEHEERRRRHTALLVVLFGEAVLGTVLAVYASLSLLLYAVRLNFNRHDRPIPGVEAPSIRVLEPTLFFYATPPTLLFLLIGSLRMRRLLSGGGSAAARLLGGRPLPLDPVALAEKRLRNTVEETAVACGAPVPEIFVLDREGGINAFAAGFTPGDAAIGVTLGAVALLTRDELQGVVAHEFSHILNGDTRLNMNLASLLHGVEMIGITGEEICLRPFESEEGERIGLLGLLFVPGAVMWTVGFTGHFFAKLVKSAISREREFLADAAAVKRTRNPLGLAGALKKIGGLDGGSRLEARYAAALSHLFFGNALRSRFLRITDTHPPLPARIRAITPSFDGVFPTVRPLEIPEEPPPPSPVRKIPERPSFDAAQFASPGPDPAPVHLEFARELLRSLPESLSHAARIPSAAAALVYALLLDPDSGVRGKQVEGLRERGEDGTIDEALAYAAELARLGTTARLPLLDLALPALRRLPLEASERFSKNVGELVRADGRSSLFEYALERILARRLEQACRPGGKVRSYTFTPLLPDCAVLLSAVARGGHDDAGEAEAAFLAGARRLTTAPLSMSAGDDPGTLDRALERLSGATPIIRRRVLDACAFAAAEDGRLTEDEAELLRALAATIDCALPPFVRA